MKRFIYLDRESNELENLLSGKKNVYMRGANIKKYPYKMINELDTVYMLQNDSKDQISAKATVKEALFFVKDNSTIDEINSFLELAKLSVKKKKYVLDRKYISVFVLDNITKMDATIDRSEYGKTEDWIRIIENK